MAGAQEGPDTTFTTFETTSSALPDDRLYEMVSPPENNNADIYIPEGGRFGIENSGETVTELPFQAAAGGDAVAYAGDPSFEGNGVEGEDGGNEYLSTRTAGGWNTQNISPLGYTQATYRAFSPDLSVGIVSEGGFFDSTKPPLAPEGVAAFNDLYTRTDSDGRYHALFTKAPPNRSPTLEDFGWLEYGEYSACCNRVVESPLYAGASADFSHVLFEADDVLTPEAEYAATGNNLYDSIGGEPTSVNVLPEGRPAPVATFGGYLPQPAEHCNGFDIKRPTFSHVISADGSRIFWTDLETGDLYVRENDASPDSATTVLVSEGGEFWTANSEGSEVFFTKAGDLYEFDVETHQTTDLTPDGEVQGVIGASEDGEYVYFVADGALAANAKQGEPNLYLSHGGETRFIATLSTADNGIPVSHGCFYIGDWWVNLGDRTAEVTPNGQDVVFESVNPLTGYDNRGTREVYVYDAEAGRISCASCNPSGEPPTGESYLPTGGRHSPAYQPQWISDDGSRVFFDTSEALVPSDGNGQLDVYEWERDGAGSCRDAGGCVYLLSGGTSPGPSYLIDASASGDDVFFVTRAKLVSQDDNDNMNLYDVHVGGVLPPSAAQCTGTGCQGVPFPPAAFEAPASVTFDGVGNFPAGQAAARKPKAKPAKCKRGDVKRKGKCVKKQAKKAGKRGRGKR